MGHTFIDEQLVLATEGCLLPFNVWRRALFFCAATPNELL